jgi:hypothetical protein
LKAGQGTGGTIDAGKLTVSGGDATGSGAGGNVEIAAGSSTSGTEGDVIIKDSSGANRVVVDNLLCTVTTPSISLTSSSGTVDITAAGGVVIDGTSSVAVTGATTVNGILKTTTTTDATSSTTGSLQTAGGLGVSKSANMGGALTVGTTATVASSLTLNGAIYAVGAEGTPASVSDTCTKGTIKWDSGFIYICTATDTWRRMALDTWA